MQYYLAIKAQIVVPEVSYRRFVQKRNLDVKRQWVTVPCVTSKYSKNVSYINVYLHSIRCFPSLRNEKRHCCYNIITTISHVISSEGIHGTEKYV